MLTSIFASANMLATYYWQRHLDEMHRHEGIFWDRYNENDEIRSQLDSTQRALERITKPCFEEPMRTYSLMTNRLFVRPKRSDQSSPQSNP